VILHAIGGLCNRLQAILSYRAALGPIRVVWLRDAPVSYAGFEDVFEPLEGVTFAPAPVADVADFAVHKQTTVDWWRGYGELRPKRELPAGIEFVKRQLGDSYAAIHVRRTDHAPLVVRDGQHATSDGEFLEWLARSTEPVFLATDNGETQQKFRAALAPRALVVGAELGGVEAQGMDNRTRQGTLADAVLDLFVCAGAGRFMGTHYSSFSETVERLRLCR
jgi:hypothetical protein